MESTIAIVYSKEYRSLCDKNPKFRNRGRLVHDLIEAYGLMDKLKVLRPVPASQEELTNFHSADYISCLKKLSQVAEDEGSAEDLIDETEAAQFGFWYDCPVWPLMFEYSCLVAGASVQAAQALVTGEAQVAINWDGGWHHSQRGQASGFCYVNDVVLAVLSLRAKFDRVLYVDLDLHHGDGVQDAFYSTPKVFTLSFHKFSAGFFPGTGDFSELGIGRGKLYNLNVPLRDGLKDGVFEEVFNSVIDRVAEVFNPSAVVCQCGADGLAGDPMMSFNLTPVSLVKCVGRLKSWGKPLLLLGGGGYHFVNTAKCWTMITASLLEQCLPEDIPEHEHFPLYGPCYTLDVSESRRPDLNNADFIKTVLLQVHDQLSKLEDSVKPGNSTPPVQST